MTDNKKQGNDDSGSFADLIGDTKPIAQGPARVKPPKRNRMAPTQGKKSERSKAFRWPDPDQLHRAAAPGVSDAQLFALGRGEPPPEERIDLHGVRRDDAGRIVRDRIASARARGLRCVLVVHGRGQRSEQGEAVLRDALPGWLSSSPCAQHVSGFAPAPRDLGGEGATLVLLRRA
jgi:DNA-nicking Smr family endonuclease